MQLPQMSGTLYAVVDLRGNCSAVSVTSRRQVASPVSSLRMQDSLEMVIGPDKDSEEVGYLWHENHGRNVELSADRMTAKRVASYNQGIVVAQPALGVNTLLQVSKEEKKMEKWSH